MRARTVPSPLWGEGQGEGENAALMVIPFTLCSLLFCRDRTRERARGTQRCRCGCHAGKRVSLAKKVADVHSIYHVAPASAAPPGDLSITTPHVKNSGAVYPKITTDLTVTFQPSHFSYAQI